MDLNNLKFPETGRKHCFWRTRTGSLIPVSYWEVRDRKTGDDYRLVEFTVTDQTGEISTVVRLYEPDHDSFVEITDLEFLSQ